MKDLAAIYHARLAGREIGEDSAQLKAVQLLDELARELEGRQKKGGLLSFLGIGRRKSGQPVNGLYIYGGVGRGKTMLMDMFYENVEIRAKKRVHFHEFMVRIHQRLHILRHTKPRPIDPMVKLGDEIASDARLLCFDEFHVSNIADAMILARLFSALWSQGVTIVSTSNWAPDELYPNGLQRDRFLPFIDLLKKQVRIFKLDHGRDYRLEGLKDADFYILGRDSAAESRIKKTWFMLSGNRPPLPSTLALKGRELTFARTYKGLLWATFEELCVRPLGAIDYLTIAKKFNTIIVEGIPFLTFEKRDETKRFMTFIDVIYEARLRLIVSAVEEPERLLRDDFHAQEFQRTVSRLSEMRRPSFGNADEETRLVL